MVSNQSNLFYVPTGRVIAAGTNLKQAGIQNKEIKRKDLEDRLDYLLYTTDEEV